MANGDGILFDGRLWHSSVNANSSGVRFALLLQYATPDTVIRIPDPTVLEWPFRFLDSPRPPAIIVQGTSRNTLNRLVAPPAVEARQGLMKTWVHNLDLPLDGDSDSGWRIHRVFRGRTAGLAQLSCHASVLNSGRTPHPPHDHDEEEILIVLEGEVELVLQSGPETHGVPAMPGMLVYYPSGQLHTLCNSSDAPSTYLMFKWVSSEQEGSDRLSAQVYNYPLEPLDTSNRSFVTARILDGPTRYLRRLEIHFSTAAAGGGYEPHVDAYDVAIVVTRGVIQTLDQEVRAGGVVFYAAGESHGLRNTSAEPATYLVCEFHGSGGPVESPSLALHQRTWRWGRRLAGAVVRRLRLR